MIQEELRNFIEQNCSGKGLSDIIMEAIGKKIGQFGANADEVLTFVKECAKGPTLEQKAEAARRAAEAEAEHDEYATRGGTETRGYDYAWSSQLELVSQLSSKPKANELGFTYMNFACRFRPGYRYERVHGIAEWCSDYYAPYSSEAQTNPQGPANGTKHVFRSSDSPVWVRNFGENRLLDTWREADWCIRLVCDDTPEASAAIERSKNN